MSRLETHAVAWAVGSTLITALTVVLEWRDNGILESFGHEGEQGQWNPTLWALAVGLWGLAVGIMALQVYFERPVTTERDFARRTRIQRLEFHVAAWVLGMLVLTPLWALVEWQDNGGFERFSSDSQPGEWEPWILYVAGIWALAIVILVARAWLFAPPTGPDAERRTHRLRLHR